MSEYVWFKQYHQIICLKLIYNKKADHKPDSVIRLWRTPYHLSSIDITINIKPPTLQHWACNPQKLVYVALHRIEFTWFHYSLTCTYFLLHLSSSHDGRALPAMLHYGVRTFLLVPNLIWDLFILPLDILIRCRNKFGTRR